MEDLGLSQKVQLELTDLLHKICVEEKIQYTLLAGTIVAWQKCEGFAPWVGHIAIGMLYPEWLRFIEACKKKLGGTNYYILDSSNCEQFNDLFIRLCKRSGVVLSEERKKDEVYYDYFINIYPICYAGDTKREFKKTKEEYMIYRRCQRVHRILSGTVNVKNCLRMARRAYYLKKKEKYTYQKMVDLITRYGDKETKYVIIPALAQNRGISCLAEAYMSSKEIAFEGHTYLVLKDTSQWIKGYYSSQAYDRLLSKQLNKATAMGPEIMRRVQLIELEMLREFDRICRKHDLKYTLCFGTLIGAVRHGGFIPWDDDVDICMLYEDYMKFMELAPSEMDTEKFFLRTQETDKDCNLSFMQIKRNNTVYCRDKRQTFDTHLGVFIDIFPLFNGSNFRILHYIQYRICKFYKTVIWSHMGAVGEKRTLYRKYYMLLSKMSNKKAYKKYIKWATIFKKQTDKLAFLSVAKSPYNTAFTKRQNSENICELTFEGYKFFAPQNYEAVLESRYADYKSYPPLYLRNAKHLPAVIEIGNLFEDLKIF